MKHIEFQYTKADESFCKRVLSIKNPLIFWYVFIRLFWLKLIFAATAFYVAYFSLYAENPYMSPIIYYIISSVAAILFFMLCLFCYSYGGRSSLGFLTVSQDYINCVGTTIIMSDDGYTIKTMINEKMCRCKQYKWNQLRDIKIYNDSILLQSYDYFITILPKRIFADIQEMELCYNQICNLKVRHKDNEESL